MSKKIISVLAGLILALSMAGCGSQNTDNAGTNQNASTVVEDSQIEENGNTSESTESDSNTESVVNTESEADTQVAVSSSKDTHAKVLVVYFSCTNTTKGVAESIAAVTGADLFEIEATTPYSSDDLNYNDSNSRSTKEQNEIFDWYICKLDRWKQI